MESLVKTVMRTEGVSEEEAIEMVDEARNAMYDYLDEGDLEAAYDVLAEYFGLEPDYLIDLL